MVEAQTYRFNSSNRQKGMAAVYHKQKPSIEINTGRFGAIL